MAFIVRNPVATQADVGVAAESPKGATGTATLDYGLAPPRRRKLWIRVGVTLAVLLAMTAAAVRFGPPLVRHVQILAWQRACMNFHRPPTRVVYATDPVAAPALRRLAPGEYIRMYDGGPAMERELPAYQGLAANLGYFTGGGTPLYMHERTNEQGQRRLVVVYCNAFGSGGTVWTWTMIPATLTAPARWVRPATRREEFIGIPREAIRVFAGQDDPDDAASFTIRFDDGGGPARVLRGELVGDRVELGEDLPTTQPSPRVP